MQIVLIVLLVLCVAFCALWLLARRFGRVYWLPNAKHDIGEALTHGYVRVKIFGRPTVLRFTRKAFSDAEEMAKKNIADLKD